ncbi:acyl-coenzyme A amino acid N-acyltransferase 1-like isoform X2 [Acanthaster planci]|uniref:Acyl-coenzyme A amino acid N-acyltransferase 1-like isoform X2 n=1 Tax=Acanthaster planci TaxID=133434 RepID=A0A8B7YQ79_ACAPL|nr:acyl-coenzyme A amino acid N-acyltransferase 1-like isoform X2 [Acanthaster planci]
MHRLLSVTPPSSLVDSKVTIRATGLEANSFVTIRSVSKQEMPSGVVKYEGHAHYIADSTGVVSVPDQISLGGTYTGAETMGLFWSMRPSPGQRFGVRYIVKDVTKPMIVHLSLHRGHLNTEALQTAEVEATATVKRWYMGQDVERITVRCGRLRGSVFKPKGPGPFPGVIDMFGSVGGLTEFRAAMLASHGLVGYALPYFRYDDLPQHMWDLELEYFMVKAAVTINGCHVNTMVDLKLNGEALPFLPFDLYNVRPAATEGAQCLFHSYKAIYDINEDDPRIYRIENNRTCQYLFIAGEAEAAWNSCHYAQEAMRRLARHGCHNYQLLRYPDAGHLIEIPYAPVGIMIYSHVAGSVVDHGGTVRGMAKASEDSWPKMVMFLHTHCGRDKPKL